MGIPLTGIDITSPLPGMFRELAPNQGSSGGATVERPVLIAGNKIASVGSSTVDGLGGAMDLPVLITGGEAEVVQRYGYRSEIVVLYRTFVKANPDAQIWTAFVQPGTTSASCTITFATNANANGVVKVELMGESIEVAVANGDTPTTVASAVATAINAQLYWLVSASPAVGVVTVTATVAGTRFNHYLNKIRAAFKATNAMTVTKSAVTPGSTDDDWTNLIIALENYDIYYLACPKDTTSATSSTDNGIGELLTALTDYVSPTKGKQGVLITGQVGTVSQAATVAQSMNAWYAFHVWAEANDWSPGMLAAHFAGALSYLEASDKAASLVDYGIARTSDRFYVPDPYTKTDRPTRTELKTALNAGVTPVNFTGTGKPYIVWHVTTKSQSSAVSDYRARPGLMPSALFDLWASTASEARSIKQPFIADDPAPGVKPLPKFNYPRDYKALMKRMIDLKIDSGSATLDPSQRDAMKASIIVERLTSGVALRADVMVVRENLKQWFLINEVSPSV